ncbi:hypothetical protein NKDENANG_01822 [Candidatus Entotheonellaceae bacterium PAL068K]
MYEKLVESWGGVPEHLQANFGRYIEKDEANADPGVDLSGGSAQIAQALWNQFGADTLADRGVTVSSAPEGCLKAIRIHESIGVDQLQFLVATETIPHDKVMSSIELFGKYIIPELKQGFPLTEPGE